MAQERLWWRDGIIYQIYPRSFADGNQDGIGDLIGITSRLDYLAELGIDAIWLSPIYPSPDVDFGYDVSNYMDIDPKFGTIADFEELVRQAHTRGIHVVLDLVLNHTSDQHPWFQQSRSSKDNPFRDYYLWRDPKPDGSAPNNWQSVFGGGGWEWDEKTGQYYFHMFYKEQPDVNWRNPKVRQAMLDVFRFWLDKGVDGFRLDVFNTYFKHPDLPDDPWQPGVRAFDSLKHIYDIDQPEMMPLLAEIRQILDSYPERYMVGETFIGGADKAAQYCGPNALHAAFNFSFLQNRWKPAQFLKSIQVWETELNSDSFPNYVLSNHDNPRAATRYGRGESDERLKVAAAMLLTLRGTPYIYYGEEIGLRDIRIRRQDMKDPVGRRYWPFFKGRDGCRAPMQWDAQPNAGFSPVQPWLPVHPDYLLRNVDLQREDANSIFNFYRRLILLRRGSTALQTGLFQPLAYDSNRLLAYLRTDADQNVAVLLNFSQRPVPFVLGAEMRRNKWELLLSNKRSEAPLLENGAFQLLPEEALILQEVI